VFPLKFKGSAIEMLSVRIHILYMTDSWGLEKSHSLSKRVDSRKETDKGHDHTIRDFKKRSRTKNALAKMRRATQRGAPVERACMRNQSLISGFTIFF